MSGGQPNSAVSTAGRRARQRLPRWRRRPGPACGRSGRSARPRCRCSAVDGPPPDPPAPGSPGIACRSSDLPAGVRGPDRPARGRVQNEIAVVLEHQVVTAAADLPEQHARDVPAPVSPVGARSHDRPCHPSPTPHDLSGPSVQGTAPAARCPSTADRTRRPRRTGRPRHPRTWRERAAARLERGRVPAGRPLGSRRTALKCIEPWPARQERVCPANGSADRTGRRTRETGGSGHGRGNRLP